MYHMSKTDTRTVVDCIVHGCVFHVVHGSDRMYHISRTGTGTVVVCFVSVELVLEHFHS